NGATDSFLYVSASGNYQVKITNASGCITTSGASTITFDTLPSNNVNITGNTKACGSDSVYLDANVNATFNYQWSNNGTNINTATNSQLLVLANGSYSVKITNSNGCSSNSTPIVITFTPYPSAPSLNGNSTSKICNGDSIRISVSAQDTGVFSYQWKLNGNNISKTDSFLYISSAGDYTAQVINNGGCATASATNINLSLHPTSTPTITAASNTTICAGDSVNLTVSSNNGITSNAWFLNGNTLNNTNANVYAKAAGPYTVNIVDNNGCKATSAATNVFVNPAPAPIISNLNATSELTTTVAFSSYQWYLNGSAITGATTQKIRIFTNGDYTVEVTDANGCKGKSAVNNVTWYVGIKNITTNASLNVYPNPSHDLFNIELPEGFDAKYITILDVTGKQISMNLIQVKNNIYTLDLSNQAAGVYLLQFNNNNKIEQIRLIKF
ncbi:MAG: T9SS type A sorting domain-containing protein, partial [Bacteroidetes bacterium]|nr:T9SS type A sorting domain-containing protein [Bacteroidota bacterium]